MITTTLLELGHATSKNLEFAQRDNVSVSYSEETITETNLLEIRRCHPEVVNLYTFSKAKEALTGADWEWHIIGRSLTLKMRVQAKRIQANNILRIKHKVRSSGIEQREVLINGAIEDNMKAIYCIYCTEHQRQIWKQNDESGAPKVFQAGCLLADAADVQLTTRKLEDIESTCIPWHYLCTRSTFIHAKTELLKEADLKHQTHQIISSTPTPNSVRRNDITEPNNTGWNAPTIEDLNENTGRKFDRTGVSQTRGEELTRLQPETTLGRELIEYDRIKLRKRGIQRMMVIDIRDNPDSEHVAVT